MAEVFSAEAVMDALARVSNEIKREVAGLVDPAAYAMAAALVSHYSRGRTSHPGRPHMKDDVRVRAARLSDGEVAARLVVGPRIGPIWQDGTVVRHDATRKNANRGRMPPQNPHLFERTAVATRAQMLQRAQQILDRSRTF